MILYKNEDTVKSVLRGQRKGGLIRQVTSQKRLNSYELFYDRKRKGWPLNTGDCLIELTAWTGLTVICFSIKIKLYMIVTR
jgi:hypothetical protein